MKEKTRQHIFRNFWSKLPDGALLGKGPYEVFADLKTFLLPRVEVRAAGHPLEYTRNAHRVAESLAREFFAERRVQL